MEQQWEQYRILLEEEKTRLERELQTFATENPEKSGDWRATFPTVITGDESYSRSAPDEQADLGEEYESELAQERVLELRLQEVNRALERIRAGTFGTCKTCGKPIPKDRLGANPAAEHDIEHQPRT